MFVVVAALSMAAMFVVVVAVVSSFLRASIDFMILRLCLVPRQTMVNLISSADSNPEFLQEHGDVLCWCACCCAVLVFS